jgi:hypothetical protein
MLLRKRRQAREQELAKLRRRQKRARELSLQPQPSSASLPVQQLLQENPMQRARSGGGKAGRAAGSGSSKQATSTDNPLKRVVVKH